MLDRYLAQYFLDLVTITTRLGSRTSIISTTTEGRIYRSRSPQGAEFPYIVIGQAHDIDLGIVADTPLSMLREVGSFNVVICSNSFESIDALCDDVVDALKMVRNRYVPTAIASDKLWCQCIIPQDSEQFSGRPIDGDQKLMLGYIIPIRAAYDPMR
jgi:hypothetical protein